jgi:hypothetical protein
MFEFASVIKTGGTTSVHVTFQSWIHCSTCLSSKRGRTTMGIPETSVSSTRSVRPYMCEKGR